MKMLSFRSGKRQAGLSLVDVMVGMVLGLIGTIIIFQVFEASERVKRTTTSGGDAQQNGVAALFALERGVKQAGYGINAADRLAVPTPVPIAVTAGAPNQPDTVVITYRPSNPADCYSAYAAQPNCAWEYGPFAATNALVFSMPQCLQTLTFSVNGSAQLVESRGVVPTCSPAPAGPTAADSDVIVEGVAQFKAMQPMLDATGNMVAIQLAVVARSAQPEKPDPATNQCNITTTAPTWVGGTLDVSGLVGLANTDDWKCYRYKTFTVTVPLRNVIWKP